MAKHTPGPWQVVSGAVQTEKGIPIAKMDREVGNGTVPTERDKNAHLIAAAPDLLAALQVVQSVLPDNGRGAWATATARAAIDKATER